MLVSKESLNDTVLGNSKMLIYLKFKCKSCTHYWAVIVFNTVLCFGFGFLVRIINIRLLLLQIFVFPWLSLKKKRWILNAKKGGVCFAHPIDSVYLVGSQWIVVK